MSDNLSTTNTLNSNENTPVQRAQIERLRQILRRRSGLTENNSTTTNNRISNENMNVIMTNTNSFDLNIISVPQTAPTRCYDPILAAETNIDNQNAIFYIANQNGIIEMAGCLDDESLNEYKSRDEFIFFRCRDTLPISTLHVSANDIIPGPLRLLNFSMRIYVKDRQAQQLQPGKRYILTPIGDVGRIVSLTFLRTRDGESASHCGTADGSQLYKIEEIRQTTGGSKKRRLKTYRKRRFSRVKRHTRKHR
jgi:hypothetical protein